MWGKSLLSVSSKLQLHDELNHITRHCLERSRVHVQIRATQGAAWTLCCISVHLVQSCSSHEPKVAHHSLVLGCRRAVGGCQ